MFKLLLLSVILSQPGVGRSRNKVPKPEPAPSYPSVEYEADFRPFMFTGGLTNKTRTETNPYGEHAGWAIGDPGVIYSFLNQGTDRVILRQPVGPGTVGWVLFSSWHPLNAEQKLDMITGIGQWRGDKHNRRVGIFFGRDATDPFIRRDVGIGEGPLLILNVRDPKALLFWVHNTQPYIDAGVSEFWLDRGSANDSPETRVAIVQLARRMRVFQGVKVGVEAIPQRFGVDGAVDRSLGPDWSYMTKVPGMGRWRNLWHSWIKHGYRDTLKVPDELKGLLEVHCFIHPNDDPPPTTGDVEWLEANGWIVSWLNLIWEPEKGPITNP